MLAAGLLLLALALPAVPDRAARASDEDVLCIACNGTGVAEGCWICDGEGEVPCGVCTVFLRFKSHPPRSGIQWMPRAVRDALFAEKELLCAVERELEEELERLDRWADELAESSTRDS